MAKEIGAKLQELPRLPKPELLALWQHLFARPAHPRLRRSLMIPILAYRIQEQAYGGLKPSTRNGYRSWQESWNSIRKLRLCSHS